MVSDISFSFTKNGGIYSKGDRLESTFFSPGNDFFV